MNFQLVKPSRVLIGRRPIHHWTLNHLLRAFGLEERRDRNSNLIMLGRDVRQNLWDLWDEVRDYWHAIRRRLHPDAGGDTTAFAIAQRIYVTIAERLRRRGLDIHA